MKGHYPASYLCISTNLHFMEQTIQDVRILPQLEKACGLDIHKDKIVGFISDKDGNGQILQEFGTFTYQLHQLKEWLIKNEVRHCLMESTGIYWMSLYAVLTDAGINVTIANPVQIKQIPKRKTDRKDARWLCTLLLHGLVRPSFVPDTKQRELRDYCRNRLYYLSEQSRSLNRILKILETNNIKIRSVICSIHTQTGMNLVRALAMGVTDKEQLLKCIKRMSKPKREKILFALEGTLTDHYRNQLLMLLDDHDHAQKQIDKLDYAISVITMEHYAEVISCLDSISGIAIKSAQVIVSEIGTNMKRFPTADHLTAWCGVAPGNNESAGKVKNTSTKKGNVYLRTTMVGAAWSAVHTKDSYWNALFQHLRKRMKSQKAIVAIARRLLKVVYKVIDTVKLYEEKGVIHFADLQARRVSRIGGKSMFSQTLPQ